MNSRPNEYESLSLANCATAASGAPGRTRTGDLLITNQLLYQLALLERVARSYGAGPTALSPKQRTYSNPAVYQQIRWILAVTTTGGRCGSSLHGSIRQNVRAMIRTNILTNTPFVVFGEFSHRGGSGRTRTRRRLCRVGFLDRCATNYALRFRICKRGPEVASEPLVTVSFWTS